MGSWVLGVLGPKSLPNGRPFVPGPMEGQCGLTINLPMQASGIHICWREGGEGADDGGSGEGDREVSLPL